MAMKKEERIVLETSRLSGKFNVEVIEGLLTGGISWQEIIRIASKNKTLNLMYYNLQMLGLAKYIPKYIVSLLDDANNCNYLRNETKLNELSKIQQCAIQKGIIVAPVKGGYLIDNLYKNRMIRKTNDIDLLIKREDIRLVEQIMFENGYEYGEWDRLTNTVVKPDATKRMLYKTKMYNLLPFVKVDDSIPNRTVIFDCSFALDFTLDTKPVCEMLTNAKRTTNGYELQPEHLFVHMCCHHYREASNVAWFLIGKDLNLIKFCDVREFILQKMDKETMAKALGFAEKHHLRKAIYFTLYFLREIYNDGYETELLQLLNIEDESFLYQFGEMDYAEAQTRKKDFWTSIFDDNNRDEVSSNPKYKELI